MSKTQSYASTAPTSHYWLGMIQTNMTWCEALSEWIDNSIDAGATRIDISKSKDGGVVISDNGAGCDDIQAMIQPGNHKQLATTVSGVYGQGGKNAAAAMGDGIHIATTCNGVTRTASLMFRDAAQGERVLVETDDTGVKSGTAITLVNPKRFSNINELRNQLAWTFAPAIRNGIEIRLFGQPAEKEKVGEFAIHETFTVSEDGFTVNASGGLLKPGYHNKADGPFVIEYGHRRLCATSEPCGDLLTNSRTMFTVSINTSAKWDLLKHKDGLSQTARTQWLYDLLRVAFDQIIRRASEEAETVELKQLTQEISGDMANMLKNMKAKRTPGGGGEKKTPGTPTGQGGEHRFVDKGQPAGPAEARECNSLPRGFVFSIQAMNGKIGKVDRNNRRVQVILNSNHKAIEHACRTKNKPLLLSYAVGLLASHIANANEKDAKQIIMEDLVGNSASSTFISVFGKFAEQL